jgi:hypothetical protein
VNITNEKNIDVRKLSVVPLRRESFFGAIFGEQIDKKLGIVHVETAGLDIDLIQLEEKDDDDEKETEEGED